MDSLANKTFPELINIIVSPTKTTKYHNNDQPNFSNLALELNMAVDLGTIITVKKRM